MIRFIIKTILAAAILFFGVLIGFQEANEGMMKMRGYDHSGLADDVKLGENEEGRLEAVNIGNKMDSHNLENKKKHLEEIGSFNFFTNMAKKIGNSLSDLINKIFPNE